MIYGIAFAVFAVIVMLVIRRAADGGDEREGNAHARGSDGGVFVPFTGGDDGGDGGGDGGAGDAGGDGGGGGGDGGGGGTDGA